MSQPATVVARQMGQGHVWAASSLGVFLWGGNEGSGKCFVFFFLSGNADYFQISWTLLCGGADLAGTCFMFKGKSLSVTLLAARH